MFGGMFEAPEEAAKQEDLPLDGAVQVEIDDRSTWQQLLAHINSLGLGVSADALHTLVTSNQLPWASVQLNPNGSMDTPLHEVENLVCGASILLWNGVTVKTEDYSAEGIPKSLYSTG